MKVLQIKVKPNSKQQRVETLEDGSLVVYLKSPPVDGKANVELIQLLAKEFQVSKSCVQIQSGLTSKLKRVAIDLPIDGD